MHRAVGVISGFGILGYRFAVQAVCLRGGGKSAKRLGANAN